MTTPYQRLCNTFQSKRRDRLASHLSSCYHWPTAKAHRTIDEYVMFLYVASRHLDTHLVPTQAVDYVWEADILQNTVQYIQTCQSLCGEVINHTRNVSLVTSASTKSTKAAFNHTQGLLAQYFGERLSGDIAACGVL